MNRYLVFSLIVGASLIAGDSYAQNRGDDRGQGRGGFGGGDRGQGRGGFGGPGGGERRGSGGRPNFMSFLPVLIALDADKNGEISGKEIENAAAALKSLDKNGDGKLTEEEVRPERPPGGRGRGGFGGGERGGFGGPPGGNRGGQGRGGFGSPGGGNRPSAADMAERMMAFDRNKDGKLTKDELSERMHATITEADTDGDGAASKEELIKLAEKRSGRGGQGDRGPGGREGQRGDGARTPQRPQFDN